MRRMVRALCVCLLVAGCTSRVGSGVVFTEKKTAVQEANEVRERQEAFVAAERRAEKARWDRIYAEGKQAEVEAHRRAQEEDERMAVERAAETQRQDEQRAKTQLVEMLIGQLGLAKIVSADLCRLTIERADITAAIARERRVLRVAAGPVEEQSDLYELASELVENEERTTELRRALRALKARVHPCSGVVGELGRCLHGLGCTERATGLRQGFATVRIILAGSDLAPDEGRLRLYLTAEAQAEAEARARAAVDEP
jgi:hypothetical protein